MARVRFTINYNVSAEVAIPAPRATLVMLVEADEQHRVPVNLRSENRVLGEVMNWVWGSPRDDGRTKWRNRKMEFEGPSWSDVAAKVESAILTATTHLQKADADFRKLVAAQPPDYIYETQIPEPAPQNVPENEGLQPTLAAGEERDLQGWAERTFDLSQPPCEEAAKFLMSHFSDITQYTLARYGQWYNLTGTQRFQAGIEWLEEYANESDDDPSYPIEDWMEWARNHRA